ncbi:beta-glucosidase [Dietzia sp. UCD-THP]|uniref:glycoside hydrolase family 3 C-terminal domain-containing protein n=1 Tax=Dietzia sp. UCD-THP TaxID=1292020 RepID=UPI000376DB7F|nr:glycoside hydrolase family 3 C-terminal domain-containing protein [Dietzia sp. UCD-THP]EYT57235.1 beta-glucosidase [Dietzia sp. UCD-THP]
MTSDSGSAPVDLDPTLDLEQLASLGSGASFWRTEELPGVPALVLTDGPHGVRFQSGATDHLGLAASDPATCFPPASGLAQSWDPDLARRIGAALAVEALAAGVGVLLGPGINIKRDPRAGRNFEYFSEDPHLTGVMATQLVRGLQAGGVGASVKHFAANNSEHDRMRASSDVDPRPLREIYLRAFERVVRDARPWTVMTAYNKINGVYASENRWLLTDLLRDEWGFDGAVISDWGAVVDRVASMRAGLDLQMPGPPDLDDADVVRAARRGDLDRAHVRRAATAVARLAERVRDGRRASQGRGGQPAEVDTDAHHELAREAAEASIVLLINGGDLLPLSPGSRVAVIGAFARDPRVQGGGSSHVSPTRIDVPLTEIRRIGGDDGVTYAAGFGTDDDDAGRLLAEAVAVASEAEVAVLMLGLTDEQESEGVDRQHIELPGNRVRLLDAVAAVQERIVVILSAGSVVDLTPVVPRASAILTGALLGQGGGRALARVLYGQATPSGRLAETIPLRIEDAPSWDNFPAEDSHVRYGEGIFVGYRGYDHRRREVRFPFGHGLSYTRFDYRSLTVVARDGGQRVKEWTARVKVHNTGRVRGREIVQIYSSLPASVRRRAPRELVGFGHNDLDPGQIGVLEVVVERRDLAYWDEPAGRWLVEGGEYVFAAAASSRAIRIEATVVVDGDPRPVRIDLESTISEAMADPDARLVLDEVFRPFAANAGGASGGASTPVGASIENLVGSIPVGRMLSGFLGLDREAVARVAEQLSRIPR